MNLFSYLDYREFLRDHYQEQKASSGFFSYRYMARKLGMDAGYLVRILQGKFHLADEKISATAAFCKLNKKLNF